MERGTIVKKRHGKKALYYVARRKVFEYAGGSIWEFLRIRSDGVAIGRPRLFTVRLDGQPIRYVVLATADVPAALRTWTES